MTTEAMFLAQLKHIGLKPEDHEIEELHAAFVRLTELFRYLETDESRVDAKSLARFDPREPL